jgi:hypothetical protein
LVLAKEIINKLKKEARKMKRTMFMLSLRVNIIRR